MIAAGVGAVRVGGARRWDAEAAAALDPGLRGVLRVLGGPGTGKTTLLVDAAAARIAAGAKPDSVLILTGSGRLGAQTRGALTAQLLCARTPARGAAAVREPVVRSVHGYAFAVLNEAAQRRGDPPPRLVSAAEQDTVIRELLAGDIEDGASAWPAALRAALGTEGFATELRDLMARCAERGVDPVRLERVGRLAGRPEWVAAGRFAHQYEQVMLLRSAVGMAAPQATVPAFGAAELIGAAVDAFAADPGLLRGEQNRIRSLFVDDAQQLDPQSAHLVRVLADGADTALLAGDPDQAVFGFRGAAPGALLDSDTPVVRLRAGYRCAPAIVRAIGGVAQSLPGPARSGLVGAGGSPGSVSVGLAASAHAEAAMVADVLRRAHLFDGVDWSRMAVIVRSVRRTATGLARVLAAAGVPVAPPTLDSRLADNPVNRALLTVLDAVAEGITAVRAEELLCGPIGGVDPVTFRRLRRALVRADGSVPPRDFGSLLVEAVGDRVVGALPASQPRSLRRVRSVLRAASRGTDSDPRAALWQAWKYSCLERRLSAAAERGGQAGLSAGRNLDAVTALFDVADQYVAGTTAPSIGGLIEHVHALRLPASTRDPVETPDGVVILSPHQALGREWDLVVIAGLQEGLWPNAIPRGGALATQRLLDELDGVAGEVSARAPVIADERRLLIAAMGRARTRLMVTAVDSGADGEPTDLAVPSPFFYDIARHAGDPGMQPGAAAPVRMPQVLSAAAVVGRLRSVVCAPEGTVAEDVRDHAAVQLARLAAAGIAGAVPDGWHGLTDVSSSEPLWSGADRVVTMSPSTLQTLLDCPLRWLLERHGGFGSNGLHSAAGSLLHALIAQSGKSGERLIAELETAWPGLPYESQWFSRNELDRHRAMLTAFLDWRADTRRELTEVGTEVDVDGVIAAGPGADEPHVRVRGRIDRLERDAAGRLVIVDVKTGKSPASKDDAQHNAQLAVYQLSVAEGLLCDDQAPGGGRLVYIGKTGANGATERGQDALTPQSVDQWRGQVREAAAQTAGPQFVARVNDGCGHCPVRSSCPAHRVTEVTP
jgi:superfamily I DNA/RNA helicase/RecB family exonuclease